MPSDLVFQSGSVLFILVMSYEKQPRLREIAGDVCKSVDQVMHTFTWDQDTSIQNILGGRIPIVQPCLQKDLNICPGRELHKRFSRRPSLQLRSRLSEKSTAGHQPA